MVDHGKSNKRKKYHDRDKYYNLAKEQGLRSRAAFKLSQINRQYPILNANNTRVVLDLCAAPGGWTQIAHKVCGSHTHVIAVDILPIRSFGSSSRSNITTIIGDITTEKCKADIHRAVKNATTAANDHRQQQQQSKQQQSQQGMVDVVLHDGAPNVGASYDKDAYEQTELAVHALKCATQHLKKHGSFVTKIYRSRDSPSYMWVLKQLFEEVHTIKPKASRQQSAEIFYVCLNYFKPDKIDPRLLDPKHIFEFVEGDTTQANGKSLATSKFNIFHKSWDKHNQRSRSGYDTEHLDFTMRHIQPLRKFVLDSKSNMEAIQLLSTSTGLSFHCEECQNEEEKNSSMQQRKMKDSSVSSSSAAPKCPCQFLLNHPLTKTEIKECVVDLKVLNKSDFKGLMIWRDKMKASWKALKEQQNEKESEDDDDDGDTDGEDIDEDDEDRNETREGENDDEDAIQQEIQKARERKLREKKKAKKRERKLMSKKRKQAALGMDLNAIEVQEHDQFFSLSTLQSAGDLDQVAEVHLDHVTEEEAFGLPDSEDYDVDDGNGDAVAKKESVDEESGYSYRLERDLDFAYERYLTTTKNGEAKIGTKSAKRSKKLLREKMAQESHEDHELLLTNKVGMDQDTKAYADLLQGPKDSDDEDSSDDDDDDDDDDESKDGSTENNDVEPMTPEEHPSKKKQRLSLTKQSTNPLITTFKDEPTSAKTARWFSNPLFAKIGEAVNSATSAGGSKPSAMKANNDNESVGDDDSEMESENIMEDDTPHTKKEATQRKIGTEKQDNTPNTKKEVTQRKFGTEQHKTKNEDSMDADDILALMPKTDKQKRHEKRMKALERDERRQKRKAKKMGETEGDFDLVPGAPTAEDCDDESDMMRMEGMTEDEKKKLIEARKLIKAGMGNVNIMQKEGTGFEVVEQDRPLPVKDDRKYDSENEDYDSDDYAKTMALGTMMLRHSKAKALVDASYNRYAWNDPEDLPEWFVDDESRHYRPQLPIPAALLAKMKEKTAALSTKPIAKVAEARARKNRRAKLKLAAAKKKAQAVANSTEMSESMKLKSISKALRSDDGKKGGKQLVVSKKGQGKKGVKGAKMVDKRMKSDKRSMDRATKKRKTGKTGSLTGSKRRRHHK